MSDGYPTGRCKIRIVYLGFHHRHRDPRLYHREMRVLQAASHTIELYFMTQYALQKVSRSAKLSDSHLRGCGRLARARAVIGQIPDLCQLAPSVIQASHARELPWAVLFRILMGARIIYDSHEDYFSQKLEYSGKTFRGLLSALEAALMEVILIRFFETVFCTDEFLYHKYTHRLYGCRSVHLLRNYPPEAVIAPERAYPQKPTLNLVYAGGINQYRGVIECADYTRRFNARHKGKYRLTLTVYSPPHGMMDRLVEDEAICHIPWVDYPVLMRALPRYDIGVCLWQRLKKFERNLPLKNFDYMAAGLPIITSNFGNLERYASMSGSAICIDPSDYTAFEAAAITLFDPEVRHTLGAAGRSFVSSQATFEMEATEYIKAMTKRDDAENL